MLIFLMQYGTAHLHATVGNPLEALLALVIAAAVGAALLVSCQVIVTRIRGVRRLRRTRRRKLLAAAEAENRARALMGELCPHGWRAQITLFSPGDDGVDGLEQRRGPVALDWMEIGEESGRPAVVRRVWAPSIPAALDAMIADRRTDETLEQIERGAVNDGALWPDAEAL